MTGPVPVWMTPSVAIVLELEAGGGASITTSVSANATLDAGVKYNKYGSPQWSTYESHGLSFGYEPPSLSVGLNASAAAGPQLELNLYSVAGPFIFAAGYLALDADILDDPWWTLTGGFKVDAGVEFEVLSYELEWGTTVFDYSVILAQATSQQVAQPSFSPEGGDYTGYQNVIISCSTDGASIRYTTDGSTPTTSSILYDAPFTLTESATVKAKAFDTDTSHDPLYNPSLTASAAYVVLSEEEYSASMDASIHITLPNTNDGTGDRLTVRNASGNPLYPPPAGSWQIDTLIWFSLASIPSGSTIDSATLKLYYYDFKDNDPAGRTLSLFRALQLWNEAAVTWNNQPLWAGVASSTAQVPASTSNWMEWDVTADVQACISGMAINYGWKITDLVPWNNYNIPITYFHSREYTNSNLRPVLKVQLAGKAKPLILQ